jgi:hypothetical protein
MTRDLARSQHLFTSFLEDEEEKTWMAMLRILLIPHLPRPRLSLPGSAAPSFEINILVQSLQLDHRLLRSSATAGSLTSQTKADGYAALVFTDYILRLRARNGGLLKYRNELKLSGIKSPEGTNQLSHFHQMRLHILSGN